MATICKIFCAIVLMISLISAAPSDNHKKIRIHVPVKHHTHLLTKTIVKTVHVPVHVPVPVKEHHFIEADDDDDEDDWAYAKKPQIDWPYKKKRYHKYH